MERGRKELLERLPKGIGAEIGVWKGEFSEHLLEKATKLYLIDPWLHQPEFTSRRYAVNSQDFMDALHDLVVKRFHSRNVVIMRGFSHEILPSFPNKFFDWVYIDGCHAYEWVKADIEIGLQKSKLVCGDDYDSPGVRKALEGYEVEMFEHQWLIL